MRHILTKQNSTIRQLVQQSVQSQRVDKLLKKHLEPEIAAHCNAAMLANGRISIETDSAAWATNLRYRKHEILNILRQQENLHNIAGMDIRVRQAVKLADEQVQSKPKVSQQTYQALIDSAECIADEKLQAALKKLASDLFAEGKV